MCRHLSLFFFFFFTKEKIYYRNGICHFLCSTFIAGGGEQSIWALCRDRERAVLNIRFTDTIIDLKQMYMTLTKKKVLNKKRKHFRHIQLNLIKLHFEVGPKVGKAGEKFHGLLQGLCFHDTLLCHWESFYHFPGPSLPRMKGAGRRKQELVGRKEDQEIGAVIILIPFYSTSIPVPKAFCQWRAWFYFKLVNLTSWKKASHVIQ